MLSHWYHYFITVIYLSMLFLTCYPLSLVCVSRYDPASIWLVMLVWQGWKNSLLQLNFLLGEAIFSPNNVVVMNAITGKCSKELMTLKTIRDSTFTNLTLKGERWRNNMGKSECCALFLNHFSPVSELWCIETCWNITSIYWSCQFAFCRYPNIR